jgi:hypothetical protein
MLDGPSRIGPREEIGEILRPVGHVAMAKNQLDSRALGVLRSSQFDRVPSATSNKRLTWPAQPESESMHSKAPDHNIFIRQEK